jgi:hypothetical protein
MISPQLHPDSSISCPPGPGGGQLNASLEHIPLPLDEPRLAVAIGADMEPRITIDTVVNGLWHCLLGSLAAGLGVSVVLGVLVLVLSQVG